MNPLKRFHTDKEMMLAWSEFILETLNEEAIARVYKRKDTTAIPEVRDIIAKSFKKLDELFTEKKKPRGDTSAV
jgi:hypothetical protein